MQGLRGLSKAKMVATLERGQHLNVQGNELSWGFVGPARDRLKSTSDLIVPVPQKWIVLHKIDYLEIACIVCWDCR